LDVEGSGYKEALAIEGGLFLARQLERQVGFVQRAVPAIIAAVIA
jgi:hypothetical protein